MESRINYFALLIIITVGVTAGNLISNLITAKYIDAEVEKASVEISNELSTKPKKALQTIKKLTKPTAIENTASQEQLIEQRKLDENGIRLAKNCSEWTVAHKDMNTQTSKRGMVKYCEQYQEYIRTGTLPPTN